MIDDHIDQHADALTVGQFDHALKIGFGAVSLIDFRPIARPIAVERVGRAELFKGSVDLFDHGRRPNRGHAQIFEITAFQLFNNAGDVSPFERAQHIPVRLPPISGVVVRIAITKPVRHQEVNRGIVPGEGGGIEGRRGQGARIGRAWCCCLIHRPTSRQCRNANSCKKVTYVRHINPRSLIFLCYS